MNYNGPQERDLTSIRDRIFKEIFYDERNKDLLIAVIETCLRVKINDVVYRNTEIPQRNYQIKGKTMDILLDTDKGKINVELNAQKTNYTNARNFSYVCGIYIRNTLVGDDYSEDVDIIQINLSYGLSLNDSLYEKYQMKNEDGKLFIKNLIIYEFNMDKINNFWYSKDEKMIKEYKYLIMLGLNSRELKGLAGNDKRVAEYMKTLDRVTVSIGINDLIDEETDQRMIRNTIKKEARKEGLQEGLQEGREEGRKEGIQIVALNLSKQGLSKEQIADACNMTIDELNVLLNTKRDN